MKRYFNDRGQAMVELALVLPILVFLLLAIMEGGRLFAGYLELQYATREAVRYSAIHTTSSASDIKAWTKNKLVILEASKIEYIDSFTLERHTPSNSNDDKWVEISIKYPMEVTVPIINDVIGNVVYLNSKMRMLSE